MSEPGTAMHRLRLWLVALVVFAAALRLIGLNFDDRHYFHPDERRIAFAVGELSFSPLQLNPHFFAYGTFPLYVTRAVTGVLSLFDAQLGHYDSVILTGRAVSGVVGALTVLLLVALGARLYNPAVGLLAGFLLAACVLHVQNSHYMTTDVFLTFVVTGALYVLVGVVQRGWTRDYVYAGIVIGLATATKFSALPLLAPLGIAGLVRLARGDRFLAVAGRGLLALVCIGLAFAAGMPYAFLDFASYYHDVEEQSRMVRNAGLLPYTNQYVGVPKYVYDLRELVLWGMAPPLGLVAIWATASRIVGAVRERSATDLVLLAWVVPFFLITGWFDVKFVRYLLPIYPVMILWAAALLWRLTQRSRLGAVLMWTVVIATALAALSFMNIYWRPHTVVTASEWAYRHIPLGKTILSQHWDEGFPMPLRTGSPGKYKVVDLPYYEPDTYQKMREIARELAGGDYIAFQTKRLYGAITMAPEKYPLSNKYFHLLFAGDLGYTLIYDHASKPGIFGIEFPDELADESITVYDHPKVLIFENTGRLSAEEILQKIMQGLPSRKLTRTDMLLATANESRGAEAAEAQPIRSSLPAMLWFALAVQVLGMGAFFIVRRWLPVPGVYALSKVLGVLAFAYLPWLLTSLGLASFRRGTLAATVVVLMALGGWAWRASIARARSRPQSTWEGEPPGEPLAMPSARLGGSLALAETAGSETGEPTIAYAPPRGGSPAPVLRATSDTAAEWWPTELLFWGVFLFFLAVRAFNPEAFWGEKPMDFSFLNALSRTTALPPPEPWFSGSTLHYTYFGHYIVAALGKLCHIHPGLTFNLGIALFGALTAMGALALGCAIAGRRGVGVLAAVFVILIGNLAGLREILSRRVVNFDYFWATSRVIKDTINEYPLWSFLFADLHAHVLVMPFSLSFLALAVWWVRRGEAPAAPRPLALFLLLSFMLGAIMVTNGWSSPTYILFFPFLIGCFTLARTALGPLRIGLLLMLAVLAAVLVAARILDPQLNRTLVETVGPWAESLPNTALLALAGLAIFLVVPGATILTALLVVCAYLFFFPFWRDFAPPARNFGLEEQSFAHFWDFANIFGLFLFIAIPFLFALWRRALRAPAQRLGALRGVAMTVVVLTVLTCWVLSVPAVTRLFPPGLGVQGSLRLGLAILAVLAFWVALQGFLTSAQRVTVVLFSFAFAVTAGTDVVYVWDRMNTIFKFYLESWFLLAAASAAAAVELWQGLIRSGVLRRGWQAGVVALFALSLFTAGTGVWGIATTRRVPTPRPTLDGTAYLAEYRPLDRAAYEWLNENVAGIPVVAEAYGPSYQEFAHVAMNTGLPTVIGWDYHVHQRAHHWPDINRRKDDLKKLYSTENKQLAAEILKKYHIALVYVGALERRTYAGGNLERFKEWGDLLQPVYSNSGVTIFAVQGQFAGTIPVMTIEQVPQVAENEEVVVQGSPGQLSQPRGLALDKDGNIYVADFGNDRIQKFNPQRQFVKEWGERGDLPGQFKQPGDVAVGPDGLVYVADTWNQRVQVFTADGEYKREWGDKWYGPRGLAIAPSGAAYLADTGNHKIRRFNKDGVEELTWGGLGKEPNQFTEPVGVTVDAQGQVYVVDNGNARLQIFDADGQLTGSIPVDGWQQKVFSEPHVAVAADGTIWVTVPVLQVVRAYDQDGTLLTEIKGGDEPELPFDRAMGIVIDPKTNELVITDLENRIVRLPATVR